MQYCVQQLCTVQFTHMNRPNSCLLVRFSFSVLICFPTYPFFPLRIDYSISRPEIERSVQTWAFFSCFNIFCYSIFCVSDPYYLCFVSLGLLYIFVPHVGPGHPFSLHPLSIHFFILAVFLVFPFSFSHFLIYFLLLPIPSPFSTRVVPLHFQAEGRRRRPNLGLVCFVYFVLSVLFS